MYGGDITQQGTSGGTIKDRSERGAFGKVLHQQIVEALLKKVNISTPKQVGLREGRTLSLILNPSAVTSTGVTDRSMHVKKMRANKEQHTLIHPIFFAVRPAGHLVRMASD